MRDLLCDTSSEILRANVAASSLSIDADILSEDARSMISSLRRAAVTRPPEAGTAPAVSGPPFVEQWPIESPTAAAELAWQVPYARTRWRPVAKAAGALAESLTQRGVRCCVQYAFPEGLTADIVVHTTKLPGIVPVMLCADCDLFGFNSGASGRRPPDDELSHILTPNLLSGRMLAHVSLLKRVLGLGSQTVLCFAASCPTQTIHSLIVAALKVQEGQNSVLASCQEEA